MQEAGSTTDLPVSTPIHHYIAAGFETGQIILGYFLVGDAGKDGEAVNQSPPPALGLQDSQ
jgi:hypothetical protein